MKNEFYTIDENSVSDLKLVKLSLLKPIEKIMPTHLQYISNTIEETGFLNKPLIIDNKHHIILDGSHRYAYLKRNGYLYAPVISVDYNSEHISVGSNLSHRLSHEKDSTITKTDVVHKALSNKLFSPRTTRHFFPFIKSNKPTKLDSLVKTHSCSIDNLISSDTVEEEIVCNQNYIKEIDNELIYCDEFTKELLITKEYLQNQVNNMKKQISSNPL